MNKDLMVATGVFVCCVLILSIAFNEPDNLSTDFDDTGPAIADIGDDLPPVVDDPIMDEAPDMGDPISDPIVGLDPVEEDPIETADPIDMAPALPIEDPIDESPIEAVAIIEDPVDVMDPVDPGGIDFGTDTTDPVDTETADVVVVDAGPIGDAGTDRLHTVERGDMLGSISQKYYGTTRYTRLIRERNNNVDAYSLQPGQRLIIPALPESERASTTSAPSPAATLDLEPGQRAYTVRRGDNYYLIAQRELGDASRFLELKRLNSIDEYELKIGDVIVLPDRGRVGPAATTEARPIAGAKVHVVALGETLGDISKAYYGTTSKWRYLAEVNGNLDPRRLKVGQRLQIPEATRTPTATPRPRTGRSTAGSGTGAGTGAGNYVIKRGDTLGEISKKIYGTTTRWKEIRDANPGLNPMKLQVGKKLVIPGRSAGGAARSTDDDGAIDFSR